MDVTSAEITTCPSCGSPAEVQWRAALASTEGPIEHAKVFCVRRHWFLLPVAQLALAPGAAATDNANVPDRPLSP